MRFSQPSLLFDNQIDIDQIPTEFGGKFQSDEPGGNVPPGGMFGGDVFENATSVKEVKVPARSKYEEEVEVTEERTVIAWEYAFFFSQSLFQQ